MCTLTWLRGDDTFTFFFNRDEKRDRLPALPPREITRDGVRMLAPIDGNAGGSWLAVNAHGLSVALLNFYDAEAYAVPVPASGSWKSRGHLVLDIATCQSPDAASAYLRHIDAQNFRPFHLMMADERGEGLLWTWSGQALTSRSLADIDLPVTTSSFRTAEVLASRRETLCALARRDELNEASLWNYHQSRHPRGGAHSVTMTRDDAKTWSISRVEVGRDAILYDYQERGEGEGDRDYLPAMTVRMMRHERAG